MLLFCNQSATDVRKFKSHMNASHKFTSVEWLDDIIVRTLFQSYKDRQSKNILNERTLTYETLPSILASPVRADNRITGIVCVAGLLRNALSNSKPSMLGIITSILNDKKGFFNIKFGNPSKVNKLESHHSESDQATVANFLQF